MDEEYHQYHHHQFHDRIHQRTPVSNKDAVKVQTGRIIRSTGGKDRHSKVFTSKGPRDRRVRLSAHTAIQFYDVQDRLGYDRPSKAVDWLITNAKAAIDNLAELPPFDPSTSLPEDHGLKCHSASSVLDGILPSFRESEAIQIPFTTSEEPVVFDEKNLVAMALQSRYTSFELGSDDFIPSGFCIPARTQGEDDHGHNF